MSTFTTTTAPRETEPRWLRLATDEVAVYKGTYNPVRTVEIAALTDMVDWVPVLSAPRLTTVPDRVSAGQCVNAGDPYGHAHDECPPRGEVTAFSIDLGGDEPQEVIWREHEQVVYRERLSVDPWDVEAPGVECRGLDGTCYLPSGHEGLCDPDTQPAPSTAVRAHHEVTCSDDIAALVDLVTAA